MRHRVYKKQSLRRFSHPREYSKRRPASGFEKTPSLSLPAAGRRSQESLSLLLNARQHFLDYLRYDSSSAKKYKKENSQPQSRQPEISITSPINN
jgi:hypothetical protein